MVANPPLTLEQVEEILHRIPDPEIPVVSIRELGILRAVQWCTDAAGAARLDVVLTPTYSGCPAMGQIEDDVRAALARHGVQATIRTQLAPAWTTDWITPQAKDKLRAYGIAPPHVTGGTHRPVLFASRKLATDASKPIPCPQCGSVDTTETSHFGSTACKALYKCLSCLEPFDYFKPY